MTRQVTLNALSSQELVLAKFTGRDPAEPERRHVRRNRVGLSKPLYERERVLRDKTLRWQTAEEAIPRFGYQFAVPFNGALKYCFFDRFPVLDGEATEDYSKELLRLTAMFPATPRQHGRDTMAITPRLERQGS